MKYIAQFSMLLVVACATKNNTPEIRTASNYFPEEKTKVLVVGTFHFDYPGLDAHKTSDEDKIDVLKEPKKSEVDELVAYIKKFAPTKIAIEATEGWDATAKLKAYQSGEYRNQRDERFQLGIRIANDLNLDTIYAIDAANMIGQLYQLDSNYINSLFKDFDFQHEDPYNQMMTNWYEEDEKLIPKIHLIDYFKLMNSKESHQYGYGAYLVGDFKLDSLRGADILSAWWYNRNVRIFRKLQLITEGTEDRILVIFGNGHAAILRQLLEASPEYEFIEFDSL